MKTEEYNYEESVARLNSIPLRSIMERVRPGQEWYCLDSEYEECENCGHPNYQKWYTIVIDTIIVDSPQKVFVKGHVAGREFEMITFRAARLILFPEKYKLAKEENERFLREHIL